MSGITRETTRNTWNPTAHGHFPIGCPLEPSRYLASFPRYLVPKLRQRLLCDDVINGRRLGVDATGTRSNQSAVPENPTRIKRDYYWRPIGSHTRAFDWCQNHNDLGWPWRAITHSVSKHVRLSEPIMKSWMKVEPYCQRRNVAQWL